MKLLYIKEELFCIKTELLNFRIALPLAKIDIVSSRLVSNVLIFLDDIPVHIQLVTFLLLSSASELSLEVKAEKY